MCIGTATKNRRHQLKAAIPLQEETPAAHVARWMVGVIPQSHESVRVGRGNKIVTRAGGKPWSRRASVLRPNLPEHLE